MDPRNIHHQCARVMHSHMTLPEMTVDETTPQPYRVFHALRGVMRAQKQLMMRYLAEKNAHMGQALSLWVLSEHEGMSPSDLADALNVKRPTVTIMLKKMEKAGLIERRPDQDDQRFMRVYLTDAGRELHYQLKSVHSSVVETTVKDMSEHDQREFERLLRVAEKNLNEAL